MKTRRVIFGFIAGLLGPAVGTLPTAGAQNVGIVKMTAADGLDVREVGSIGGIKLGATEAQVRAAAGGETGQADQRER